MAPPLRAGEAVTYQCERRRREHIEVGWTYGYSATDPYPVRLVEWTRPPERASWRGAAGTGSSCVRGGFASSTPDHRRHHDRPVALLVTGSRGSTKGTDHTVGLARKAGYPVDRRVWIP